MMLRPHRNPFLPSPDVIEVTSASAALNIREINLFRIAYRWWFGREASEREVEKPFMDYLFSERAPFWVRQFTREVLRREQDGRLDPRDFGLPSPPVAATTEDLVDRACRAVLYAIWTMIIAIIAIAVFK